MLHEHSTARHGTSSHERASEQKDEWTIVFVFSRFCVTNTENWMMENERKTSCQHDLRV